MFLIYDKYIGENTLQLIPTIALLPLGAFAAIIGVTILFPVEKEKVCAYALLCGFSFQIVINLAKKQFDDYEEKKISKSVSAGLDTSKHDIKQITKKTSTNPIIENINGAIRAIPQINVKSKNFELRSQTENTIQQFVKKLSMEEPNKLREDTLKIFETAKISDDRKTTDFISKNLVQEFSANPKAFIKATTGHKVYYPFGSHRNLLFDDDTYRKELIKILSDGTFNLHLRKALPRDKKENARYQRGIKINLNSTNDPQEKEALRKLYKATGGR